MQEFFETDFGEQLKKSVRKTKIYYDGQAIYEVVDKSIPGLKKGDQIYLDGAHKDHIEVFDKRGRFKKVMNLDGSVNDIKTKSAL
ncbi:hemagglutinin [Streptococcus gordonii]|uniref:hemagglutinin n=1 Tax=Streptococcus gordonii TaxID=1302 RepID=UPI001CC00C71|nr:hemagglutinin [Streptococcus gordonii]WAM21874.1 hemagglutinin [Streptococcus gordonii]